MVKTESLKLFATLSGMFCNGINICDGIISRTGTFIILLCFQIVVLGTCVYHMHMHLNGFGGIQLSKRVHYDDISNLRRSNFSRVLGLETNETLGEFYYIPDSMSIQDKKLFLWREKKIVQVDASSIIRRPFVKAEREMRNSSNCNLTRPIMTSKINLESPNCTAIREKLDELSYFVFQEEIDFRIAYSILVHTDYEMMELLLRTIYKPQNTYCIHIDVKSSTEFKQRVSRLADCFQNVFIATKLVKVFWGKFSVLEAEMSCMKDLLNKTKSWKYFINLTGQEFPLRTNYEIAKVLYSLRGFNNLKCSLHLKQSDLLISGPAPYNLTAYKSSTHVVLTRSFVEYLLNNKTAKAILNWSKKLKIPSDEIAFSTVNCNKKLKAPGSFGDNTCLYSHKENYVGRFKLWIGKTSLLCHGKRLRGICTFGPKDLETLKGRHELFANKFNIRKFPQVPNCLRNTLLERTYLEYTGRLDYNVSYYEHIPYKL